MKRKAIILKNFIFTTCLNTNAPLIDKCNTHSKEGVFYGYAFRLPFHNFCFVIANKNWIL